MAKAVVSPKEKAEEMYEQYSFGITSQGVVKKCAIIAVNQLIEEHTWNSPISWNVSRKKYWEQVKEELEKMS